MNREKQEPISKAKLVLVEGMDEVNILNSLFSAWNIQDIEVREAGGKHNMRPNLKAISINDSFRDNVYSVGIIRDADESFDDTWASICGALSDANLPVPQEPMISTSDTPNVTVMILPNNEDQGMLEDVFAKSIDNRLINCVDTYYNCMREQEAFKTKNLAKSQIYTYLSVKEDPSLRLGESAAKSGYWGFDHQAFSEIKTFLESL